MPKTILVWFRNDLRVEDHEALAAACAEGDEVIPVYCLDPRYFTETRFGFPKTGAFRAKFLLEGLRDLKGQLQAKVGDLLFKKGKPEEVLPELCREYGAEAIFFHEEVASEELEVESALQTNVGSDAELKKFWGATLYHPEDLPFRNGEVQKVFTQFRKMAEKKSKVRPLIPAPEEVKTPKIGEWGEIPTLKELGMEEPPGDEKADFEFVGGTTAAKKRLDQYIWETEYLKAYKFTRNGLLGANYASRFSPWLAQGSLSPRYIYEQVRAFEREVKKNVSTYWMIFELIWRDYFRFWALRFGDRIFWKKGIAKAPPSGSQTDRDKFRLWQEGMTGVPFVDANMRELNATGFMSNRGRQNVASFLVHDLGLDWRMGAEYFESLLVDYDVCSNYGNWAYVAGVGADPRPDRYFNVISQARRYDEKAKYIKHWLPELAEIPAELAHQPWTLSDAQQSEYNYRIGVDYPAPALIAKRWHNYLIETEKK